MAWIVKLQVWNIFCLFQQQSRQYSQFPCLLLLFAVLWVSRNSMASSRLTKGSGKCGSEEIEIQTAYRAPYSCICGRGSLRTCSQEPLLLTGRLKEVVSPLTLGMTVTPTAGFWALFLPFERQWLFRKALPWAMIFIPTLSEDSYSKLYSTQPLTRSHIQCSSWFCVKIRVQRVCPLRYLPAEVSA